MNELGFFWFLLIILGICITIAPLIIWRNTNRTNRLLALQLAQQGVKPESVRAAWSQSGSTLASVPGYEDTGLFGKAKEAGRALKKTYSGLKGTPEENEEKPRRAEPKVRFCHRCGADAPLDATVCPGCGRGLADYPVYCPKCGHEISHQPPDCPGCKVKFRWREGAS